MITIKNTFCNNFDEKSYENLIKSIDISHLGCTCKHYGCFVKHGYYQRKLKLKSGTIYITILRVKCTVCGRTHAVLPDIIVPYSQVPVDIQRTFLLYHISDEEIQNIMNSNPDISETDFYRSAKKYKTFWRERLTSVFISVNKEISNLIACCFNFFRKQFMQIHRGINLLFIKST